MHPVFSKNMVSGFNEQKGNVLTSFYLTYLPVLRGRVSQLTCGSFDTDDLVHLIFLKILKQRGHFETLKNIENFMDRVCETTCEDYMKRMKTRQNGIPGIFQFYHNIEEHARRVAQTMDTINTLNYLAMEILPPKCKEVYNLYFVEKLKNRDIAEKLGITEKIVEHRKSLALKMLKTESKLRGFHVMLWPIILPVIELILYFQNLYHERS